MNGDFRRNGLLKFAAGVAGSAALLWAAMRLVPHIRGRAVFFGLIILAMPAAYGLIGLIEAVSGIPFMRLSDAWDGLKGWQRGVIGFIVVCIAGAIIIGGAALVLKLQ